MLVVEVGVEVGVGVVGVVRVVFLEVWSVIPFQKHNSSDKSGSSIYF